MSERKAKSGTNPTEDWHKTLEKITTEREQYQYMLDHDILTDCTFVVGPEGGEILEFKAHRLHMARVSPVFAAMFMRSEMVEAKTGHVRVTDLAPHTFYMLVSSIYGKEPAMSTFQEAQNLAFAAHKYQMNALLETCVTRMIALNKPAHIWTALETADLLQVARLKETCVQVLQRDTLPCILNARVLQVSEEHLALLLEQDELDVEDELILVNITVHWARCEAQRRGLKGDDEGVRAVLKPRLLSLFRFRTMSLQQFMLGSGLAGWLTSDEKTDVISYLMRSKNRKKWPQHLSAVAQKRKNVTDVANAVQIPVGTIPSKSKQFFCKRKIVSYRPNVRQRECCLFARDNDNAFHYDCLHTRLIFKVSASCKLLGFVGTSRSREGTSTDPTAFEDKNPVYKEEIVVKTFTFNHTLATDFTRRKIDEISFSWQNEYNSVFKIMFEREMTLDPDNWFALEVTFKHLSSNINHNIRSDVPAGEYPNPSRARSVHTVAGVEFTFRTEELEGYRTSLNDGVFESLIFSL